MDVTLTPDLERFVRDKVASGDYASPQEAVNAGLEYLRWRDDFRRKVDEGVAELDRGEGLDGELVFQELRERLDKLQSQGAPR